MRKFLCSILKIVRTYFVPQHLRHFVPTAVAGEEVPRLRDRSHFGEAKAREKSKKSSKTLKDLRPERADNFKFFGSWSELLKS